MRLYTLTSNIKAGLFVLALILVASLLAFSQKIVNELRSDHREIVKLYSELIASASSQSDESLDFIFENIIKKVQFPIIQSDTDGIPQFYRNLEKETMSTEELTAIMNTMDRQNSPIPLIYIDGRTEIIFGHLHYGDNLLIQRLRWLPFIEISAVALFILVGFVGFTIIRNNEKHHIWVGMARETAHQLGTPVSALMGWVDLLKEKPERVDSILNEMNEDINRLDQIGNRFSKMGSSADKSNIRVAEMVTSVVNYLERRLPSLGKQVTINNTTKANAVIQANEVLLSWALENVIRNGIDAIEKEDGMIDIWATEDSQYIYIHVRDNGKGILRKDRKHVFRPGFSTKSRGWGLGLSLTQRIIQEIHSGSISIVDSSPGIGSEFQIRLPKESSSMK